MNLGVSKRHLISQTDSRLKPRSLMSERELIDLCYESCNKTIRYAGLSFGDIGYFIVTHDASPFLCPSLSQLLVRKLGLTPHIRHVNVQGMACAAFAKALQLAENHIAAYPKDFVLVCISGVNSYWFHNQVRGIEEVMEIEKIRLIESENKKQMELRKWIATIESFLFGDGIASLIVTRNGEGLQVDKIVEVTNPGRNDYLSGYARLAVLNEPFKFGFYSNLDTKIPTLGVKYTSLVLDALLGDDAETTMKIAKKWATHTGSKKILNHIAENYGIQYRKLKESHEVLRNYGNLAGASLPFILERILAKNEFSIGDKILVLGYGWGFSASACLMNFLGN